LFEGLEQPRLRLRFDADAGIGDFEANLEGFRRFSGGSGAYGDIALVASTPFSLGICMSIRIRA
jgi:hypothetical protein